MRKSLFIAAVFALAIGIGCNAGTKRAVPQPAATSDTVVKKAVTDEPADSLFEEAMLDSISQIPQVRKSNHYIDSISGHKHGISMVISQRPVSDTDYYFVQVGYNNEIRFEIYYNFYVYEKGFRIMYLDSSGEEIDVAKWKKE